MDYTLLIGVFLVVLFTAVVLVTQSKVRSCAPSVFTLLFGLFSVIIVASSILHIALLIPSLGQDKISLISQTLTYLGDLNKTILGALIGIILPQRDRDHNGDSVH